MQNILAAVDFSPASRHVVARASELAKAVSGRLWLIHAAAPEPDFVGYEAGPAGIRDQVAEHLREEHRQLQSIAEGLRADGIEAKALLIQGPTIETIVRESEKLEADLIVVGSHGRGAVVRALLGSTSEGVLRKAKVPVMIVPARGPEAP